MTLRKLQKPKEKLLILEILPLSLGEATEGNIDNLSDLESTYGRQQVRLRSVKHSRQGQLERFRKTFPLAVALETSHTTDLVGGLPQNVAF